VNFYVNAESNDDRRSSSGFGANTKAKYPTKLDLNHDCVCDLTIKGLLMGSMKKAGEKKKLIAARRKSAPRWADIKKFGLKRARGRRIRSVTKNWRRGRYKV